eukprot:76629_1
MVSKTSAIIGGLLSICIALLLRIKMMNEHLASLRTVSDAIPLSYNTTQLATNGIPRCFRPMIIRNAYKAMSALIGSHANYRSILVIVWLTCVAVQLPVDAVDKLHAPQKQMQMKLIRCFMQDIACRLA